MLPIPLPRKLPSLKNAENKSREKCVKTSGDPYLQLETITTELSHCSTEVENLRLPIKKNYAKLLTNKLDKKINQIDDIPENNQNIRKLKTQLSYEAISISKSIETLNDDHKILKNKQNQIVDIIESESTFKKKKLKLETLKEEVDELNTPNNTLITLKKEILDKISGFILAETAIYCRQNLKKIEQYQNYAQQFAFPKKFTMYNIKENEIATMKNSLKRFSENNKFFEQRRHVLNDRVEKVLKILECRADENEETLSNLEKLESIQLDILNSTQNLEVAFDMFNTYRARIGEFKVSGCRIFKKKMEVLQCLHNFEKTFYEEYFEEVVPTIAVLTEKYEMFTRYLHDLKLDHNFREEKQAITKQWTCVKAIITNESLPQNSDTLFKVIKKLFNHTWKLLTIIEDLNKCFNDVKYLKSKLDTCSEDLEKASFLRDLENKVDLFEANTKRNSLLKILPHIKLDLAIEKSQIELNSIVCKQMKTIKENIDSNEIPFVEKITELFILKETIEDMPVGNLRFDSLKESILNELQEMMIKLNNQIANYAFKKRQFENVVNIDKFFSTFKPNGTLDKESVQYVEMIYLYAKTFEDAIKCFLGIKESLDFYIIHEHLMRLLEELDQLECEDDTVFMETVKTMDYIKKLKSELFSNASVSD